MLRRLGRATARWRYVVLGVWAAVALAGAVFGAGVYDRTESVEGARGESAEARERLEQLKPEGETVVAVIGGADFFTRTLIDSATAVMHELRELPGVADVRDAYTAGGLMSDDGQSSLAVVELDPGLDEDAALEAADRVAAKLRTIDAPEILVGGKLLAERSFAERATEDAIRGEAIALALLAIVLVLFGGGLTAGALPLGAALAAITGSLLALNALAGALSISEFAVNVVTLLGLGLSVDYSLLMLARYREERAADPDGALERTVAGAGQAVLVSGLAVAIALAALAVFADPLLSAMAVGGALAVVTATVAALTLVPALLAVADRRIPAPGTRTWVWRRERRRTTPLLARLAAFAQRRPAVVALTVSAGLLALALPALGLEVADADARSLPAGAEERRVLEALERDFTAGPVDPIEVLIEAPRDQPAVSALIERMQQLPDAKDGTVRDDLPPAVTAIEVDPAGPDAGERAQALVRAIRDLDAPVGVLVGGAAAELVDAKASTAARLPLALAVVGLPTLVLLFALTRSVLIPLKAIVLNLLTLGATLGIVGVLFAGPLDITTPLLLFMFIFGLSMDYEVFLLARIKEEWQRRRDNDAAVLAGIAASGPVISVAALAIGIVFAGFALGELAEVREIGVGMAIAVALDVTVVRGLLLPAAMSLLGPWNWWPGADGTDPGRMV